MRKMVNFCWCLMGVVFLVSCSTHEIKAPLDVPNYDVIYYQKDTLWNIVVVRWGKERFSGILAIHNEKKMLSIAVVDPSGIKLFEENISNDGEINVIQKIGFFKKSHIPEYLGEIVYRIFKKLPTHESCSGAMYNLCWLTADSGKLIKKASWGPISLWDSNYYREHTSELGNHDIEYHSPWTGTTLLLERL